MSCGRVGIRVAPVLVPLGHRVEQSGHDRLQAKLREQLVKGGAYAIRVVESLAVRKLAGDQAAGRREREGADLRVVGTTGRLLGRRGDRGLLGRERGDLVPGQGRDREDDKKEPDRDRAQRVAQDSTHLTY